MGFKSTIALPIAPYPFPQGSSKLTTGGDEKYDEPGSVISTPIILAVRLISAVTSDNPSVLSTIPPSITLPAPPIPSPPSGS